MLANGYNPMRHNCGMEGCFIASCRPKSEWFCSLFPGKISFSDLDRIVEICGRGLIFEWKRRAVKMPLGQDIMWKRLTRSKLLTVFCAAGDVSEMALTHYAVYYGGEFEPWRESGLIDFTERIRAWVTWAQANPLIQTSRTEAA